MRTEKLEAVREWLAAAAIRAHPALAGVRVELELPRDPTHGDLASNLALREGKRAGLSPRELAGRIRDALEVPTTLVERVDVEGPGFINLHWSRATLVDELAHILAVRDAYGREPEGLRGRVLLEFVSANPTGPLNVVSARAAAVGDSLARLMRYRGHTVETEFYVNDAGTQVAGLGASVQAVFREKTGGPAAPEDLPYRGAYIADLAGEAMALAELAARMPSLEACERTAREAVSHWGRGMEGPAPAAVFAELESAHAMMISGRAADEAFRARAIDILASELDFAAFAVSANLAEQKRDLEAFGVHYDSETGRGTRGWFRESWLHAEGAIPRVEQEYEALGLVRDADGARWLTTTARGDTEDRVIRRTSGESTYFLADIAYHLDKARRGCGRAIDIWGPDHHGHVKRMQAALELHGLDDGFIHVIIAQQVNLLRDGVPVKMSKRAGEFVTLAELIEEVGRDVARFYFLMRRTSSPLDFDIALATRESEENPVFYVQYAYARIRSIFELARERGVDPERAIAEASFEALTEPEELELMKMLGRLPSVAEGCVRALDPQGMGSWLRDLAQVYHRYYHRHRVLVDDPRVMGARLALTEAVRLIIGNGLRAIGIEPPKARMERDREPGGREGQ